VALRAVWPALVPAALGTATVWPAGKHRAAQLHEPL